MATTVYEIQVVTLQDDDETQAILKPLKIAQLRKFMKKFEEFKQIESEDDMVYIEKMFECAEVCLQKQFPDKGKDWFEEALDVPTIYKVIEVCAGINLNDPNLAAAMTEAIKRVEEEAGTN